MQNLGYRLKYSHEWCADEETGFANVTIVSETDFSFWVIEGKIIWKVWLYYLDPKHDLNALTDLAQEMSTVCILRKERWSSNDNGDDICRTIHRPDVRTTLEIKGVKTAILTH